MMYSIIPTAKGQRYGFSEETHLMLRLGTYMVVNENELRKVCADIGEAAVLLGGTLLTHSELINIIKNNKRHE